MPRDGMPRTHLHWLSSPQPVCKGGLRDPAVTCTLFLLLGYMWQQISFARQSSSLLFLFGVRFIYYCMCFVVALGRVEFVQLSIP